MKKWCLGLCACAWATLVSAATTFNDSTGDIDPSVGSGSGALDIVSVEVSHTATDIVFALTVDGDIGLTDFGKYAIGIATGGTGTSIGNGWNRPIYLDSPIGGMNVWIGSWVDGGGGAELYSYDGTNWNGPGVLTDFSFTPGTQSRVSFTVAQADLGVSSGDMFYYDVYASGGMPSDSAVDALSNPDISITAWDQSYTSRTNDTGLSDYTLAATADVVPGQGPFAGGNAVLVTNAVPAIGNGADITNVLVGGVAATPAGQGANWVAFVAPATGSAGAKDVVIQSASLGNSTLAGAYTVNPAGEIGGSTSVTKWSAVGDAMVPGQVDAKGANNTIYGLGMSTSRVLYACGSFTNIGGSNCYRVARYDGTNWSDMEGGVFRVANVNCIVPSSDGIVYAGGYFTNIGGSYTSGGILANDGGTNSRAVAKWNGNQWEAMGDHVDPNLKGLFFASNVNGYVNTILPSTNGPVYAGGYYTNTDFTYHLNYVSKWTGTAWTNMQDGFRNVVMCMAEGPDGTVYAGGSFTNWAGAMSNQFQLGYVARWNGTSWTNMGLGLGNRVTCLLAARDGTIYAGGWFTNAANPSSGVMAPAQYVAKWTGTAWTNVGSGFNNWVYALAEGSDGTIYAGGSFTNTYDSDGVDTNAAKVRVSRIARFDGARWHPLGGAETNGASDTVLALAADPVDGAVYAGGMFKTTFNEDGTSNNTWYVARYGSNTVSSIGVEPSTGSVTGGVEVVISGTNLGAGADITNVTICGASVASISSQSATQVVVVAGAGAPGLGDVVVFSTSFGETVKSNAFTYVGPSFALLGTNGAAVANGAAAAAAAGTHFGEVLSGATVTNVFTITNAGNATLNLSWTTNGSAAFSVMSGPASVGAGAAADLAVAYASSGAAATAAVEIVHDAAFSPFLLHLASDSSLLAQTITFPAIADQVTTGVVGLAATASSGLPVSFGVASGSASISGGTNLSFSGAGSVSIVASQGGDATYAPAPDATNTFNVAKAVATVTLTNLAQTYDGTARVAACTTEPAGLTVDITYDGGTDAPTNAGSYAITGTVNEVLYQGQAAGTLVVSKGAATVTLTNLNATYDGTPKPAAATTDPAGLTVEFTYDGSATAPSAVGSYAVTGTVVDANWLGEATGTLVIGKMAQTIAFAPIQPQKLAASVGLSATGGGSGHPVTFAVTAGPGTIAGDTNLTFSGVGDVVVVASQAGDATYEAAAATNVVKVFSVVPDNGPFAGGNSVTVSNGNFGTITNVLVGGAAAAILDSGASWVTVAMPAAGAAGMVDVAVQTSDNGETVLANAYAYNPAGWIGGEPDWSQWVEVEGLPTNRFQMSAAVLSNRIYAVGGANNYGTAKSNVYCFAGTSWTEVSSLPTGRINTVAGELNGSLIVAGGRRGPTGQCTNTYRFTGAGWEEVAGLPVAFADMAGATYAGAFYAIGGNDSGSQTNVYRFDGTNWTEVAGLPAPRDNMGAAACGDYLYAVGGVVSPGPTYHTNVYRYDGTNWTEVAGLPAPRGATGVAARDGALFVVGGQVEEEGEMGMPMTVLCTNVYRFDGTGWTEMAGLPQAEGMDLGLDLLANLDGVLYAFGSPLIVTNVYRYPAAAGASGVEPASGSWTGDYEVVIIGTNLCNGTDVTNVTLCGVAAQSIQSMSATQIVVIAGQAAAAGLGDVVVQSTSYGETVKSNVFTYLAPEFAMEGGELDVASGEAARLETGADFAVVRVGASRTNEFRIRNPGDETLTISATVTNGAAAEMFAVLDETGRRGGGGGMPSQLDPGDSGLFGLVFAPTAAGAHSASLEFTHDGPDSPFVLNLAGMGYEVSAGEGPFAGGNTITVTGGAFGTITNVLVGGTSAAFTQTGPNEFTVTLPPAGADGAVDVVVQTSDNGDVALAGAYVYNPPGRIGFEGMICGWEELAGLPVAKYYLGAGSFQGSVYAVGGMQYVESWGFVPVTNVYRWDGTAWTEVEGLPGAASSLGVATFRDGLYALGGYSGVGVRTNVYRFDGTNWTEVAGLPAGRSQGAAAVWEDQLYYLGGWTNVYRYDGTNWTEVASLPESMVSVTASAWDGKLYAIGGFGDGLPLTAVYAYDGSGWTAAASLPVPMAHASSGVLEDGLHVWAGAYDNDEWTTNVYRFDGARWQLEGALPNGRYAVGGCVHDGALHAVGGFGPNGVGSEGATTNVYRSISCNLPGVEPSMGTWAGEYEVAIRGVDLGNGMDVTNVTLCGVPVASIVSQSATQIVVVAGAAAGPVVGDVRVFSTSFGETVGSDAFTYLRADQTIDFPAIPDQFATNATPVSATASSGLPVMFEVVGGPATLSETWGRREPGGVQSPAVATYSATGLVSIVARQAGGTNWNSAPSVTNTFRVRGVYALEIEPAPGATEPAAGSYSHGEGTVLTNAAITPATAGSTQYVCVGWTLSGHEPASGTETQMVMTVTNDAVLTWLWTTNYRLATASGGHGSVQPESGWQPAGVATQVLAEADEYFVFANWTGDASGSDNPLALTMDAAKSVTANFAALYTTNRPTPLWWLADHGIAGDFEAAVNGDPDEDGVPTGDEWVMDTDPTNGASFLAFDAVWPLHGSNCWDVVWTNEEPPYDVVTNQECEVIGHVYRWRTSTGRVYRVQGAAGMHAPWLDLDGMTNLMPQGPELTVTNPATDPERMRHYRVRVRLP